MADNNRSSDRSRSDRNQSHQNRDRRRDRIVEGVKSRPYTAAAVATLAGAAGAAAYFLSRRDSDKPLMNWGQSDSNSEQKSGASAYKQGSTSKSRTLETASASPSASAGTGATSGTGKGSAKGSTGLDQSAQDQTKTGSIAYGA